MISTYHTLKFDLHKISDYPNSTYVLHVIAHRFKRLTTVAIYTNDQKTKFYGYNLTYSKSMQRTTRDECTKLLAREIDRVLAEKFKWSGGGKEFRIPIEGGSMKMTEVFEPKAMGNAQACKPYVEQILKKFVDEHSRISLDTLGEI